MARQVQGACESILQRLPASALQKPASAADLQHLRQFANCIRQHGIPNWPDPRPDGTFPLVGTPLAQEGKSPRWLAADRACQQYWSRGLTAHDPHADPHPSAHRGGRAHAARRLGGGARRADPERALQSRQHRGGRRYRHRPGNPR
jgi:hypothetical protein